MGVEREKREQGATDQVNEREQVMNDIYGTIKNQLNKSYIEVVEYAMEDAINAELNEENYETTFSDCDDLIEAVWNDFVKYNGKEARFIGKDIACSIVEGWLNKEDQDDVRKIVKNY